MNLINYQPPSSNSTTPLFRRAEDANPFQNTVDCGKACFDKTGIFENAKCLLECTNKLFGSKKTQEADKSTPDNGVQKNSPGINDSSNSIASVTNIKIWSLVALVFTSAYVL